MKQEKKEKGQMLMCSPPFLPPEALPIFAEVRIKQMFPAIVYRRCRGFLGQIRERKERNLNHCHSDTKWMQCS